jgi:transcriptional regulator with XRE-family HTH domain
MSQAELAECIDFSVTYISHIETARKQASLEALVRIANALGVTTDLLLNGNQTNDPMEYRSDLLLLIEDCNSYEKRMIYEMASAAKNSLRKNKWLQRKIDSL